MNKLKTLIESGLIDREDGTILDTKTNLVWQKEPPNGFFNLDEVSKYCKELRLAGYDDWRLPTIKELETLINKRHKPTIDPTFKCHQHCNWYWTSTTYDFYEKDMWLIYFGLGSSTSGPKTCKYHLRADRNNV